MGTFVLDFIKQNKHKEVDPNMGKLKISKTKKSRSSKGTSGIPNWLLSTIIIVVVIAVLTICISTAIFSSGILGRWTTAMKLGDIKVTQNMMAYFFRSTYISQISTYAQYVGESGNPYSLVGIDPTKSLKDQASFDEKQSWYDYLLSSTKTSVSQYLVYAAAAKDAGIELDKDDEAEIDTSLENLILNIRYSTGMYSGYSDDACCTYTYGDGVKKSDVRDAIALQVLAEKMSNTKGEEIEKAVEGNEDRINKAYKDDSKLFNYTDYLLFSFDVDYEDVVAEKYPDKKVENLSASEKEAVLALYKEKIEAARKNAEELATKNTIADYNNFIAEFVVNEEYTGVYTSAMKDVKSEKLPSEDNLKTIKEKLIATILTEIAEGKTTANDDTKSNEDKTEYTIYDISVSKEFAEGIKAFKEKLFSTVLSTIDASYVERATYYEPENKDEETANTWAFDADRKALDIKKFESGDGANKAEVKVKDNSFSAEVILLAKTSYKVETLSRDFAYLLFTKEASAKAAIESIKKMDKLDKDSFLKLAEDEKNPADAHQFIEDCVIYSMQSEELDNWLFDEDTKEGDYTTTALVMSDGSYMVALYVKQNSTPEWKYRVMDKLISDDYTAFEDGIFEKFEKKVETKDSALTDFKDSGYAY